MGRFERQGKYGLVQVISLSGEQRTGFFAEACFLLPHPAFEEVLLRNELRHQPYDDGRQEQAYRKRKQQQEERGRPALCKQPRNDRPEEKEQGAVDAERDDRVAAQVRDDAGFPDLLAEQHDGENAGKSGEVDMDDVSRITVRPHTQGRGREVHRNDRQQDEQRNQFVETVVRKEEEVVAAYPESCEVERQGRHGDVDIERQFDPLPAQPEPRDTDQHRHDEHQSEVPVSQVMDDVEEDVAVEKSDEEPDRRIETDQLMSPEHQQQLAPAHRKPECSGQQFRDAVHQQEGADVEDQERDEQFVGLADQETPESFVGFEKEPRDEEIERHGETRKHETCRKAFERAPDMQHHNQYDT